MISSIFFFFNDTATTEIYTLSLHDALPIWHVGGQRMEVQFDAARRPGRQIDLQILVRNGAGVQSPGREAPVPGTQERVALDPLVRGAQDRIVAPASTRQAARGDRAR